MEIAKAKNVIGNEWDNVLAEYFSSSSYALLEEFLENEYKKGAVFPPREQLFSAYKLTDFANVKAVIIGQDPYHTQGVAHGLCFSAMNGSKTPPSLRNIFKELYSDLGIDHTVNTELFSWAKEGILLINAVMSVRKDEANSHKNKGWEQFTEAVICKLNDREKPVVFMLWGANAQYFERFINSEKHLVLKAAHPSPLSASRGFFGCKHFSKTNSFLAEKGLGEIAF